MSRKPRNPLLSNASLFNVLSVKKGNVYLGNELITDGEIKSLAAEAKFMHSSRLYRVIIETAKYSALDDAAVHSHTWDDVLKAKGALYTINVVRTLVEKLRLMA